MRNATRWIAALCATAIVAGGAMAQPPQRGQGQGRGGAGFGGNRAAPAALLANEDVQKELKPTDEQKEKIKAFAPQQRQPRGAGGQGGGGQGGQGGQRGNRGNRQGGGQGGAGGQGGGGQANSEAAQAADKFVKETLNADQQKRFKQIRTQVMGIPAFADEEVQTALKLTDDQKAKFKTLIDDYNKDVRELMPQGGRGQGGAGGGAGGANIQETMQKRQALTKDYMEKAQGALTEEQKKAWKDLTGATFTLQVRRPVPSDR